MVTSALRILNPHPDEGRQRLSCTTGFDTHKGKFYTYKTQHYTQKGAVLHEEEVLHPKEAVLHQ